MMQMYKVFMNEKVIFFTKNSDVLKQLNNAFVIYFYDDSIVSKVLDYLNVDNKIMHVVFLTPTPKEDFEKFTTNFDLIVAAGGKVTNNEGKTLFIFRLGKWDLPKGKVEKKESVEQAAIREVEEECGISQLTILNHIKDTYHIYELNNKLVLKQSIWYEMKTTDSAKLVPQTEENITDARWMTTKEIENIVLKNTYPSIKEVLE
ncbi:MAG: NUDIX hydrolase [Flavobacteriales bacterium CG18_big_fil_WC_8_21_14_2_50_32_9]|nr:MAG: NUDIX hydrolase [Flavobacteriales bacterium CG18_big_fil_WC_8_21_14_2_50_32_9]PIZ06081.1 MAG: NUDIX hydrolase [Flavobacteriales bacterium CG_4_10_14_0_8_um_filter_32_5]